MRWEPLVATKDSERKFVGARRDGGGPALLWRLVVALTRGGSEPCMKAVAETGRAGLSPATK